MQQKRGLLDNVVNDSQRGWSSHARCLVDFKFLLPRLKETFQAPAPALIRTSSFTSAPVFGSTNQHDRTTAGWAGLGWAVLRSGNAPPSSHSSANVLEKLVRIRRGRDGSRPRPSVDLGSSCFLADRQLEVAVRPVCWCAHCAQAGDERTSRAGIRGSLRYCMYIQHTPEKPLSPPSE